MVVCPILYRFSIKFGLSANNLFHLLLLKFMFAGRMIEKHILPDLLSQRYMNLFTRQNVLQLFYGLIFVSYIVCLLKKTISPTLSCHSGCIYL